MPFFISWTFGWKRTDKIGVFRLIIEYTTYSMIICYLTQYIEAVTIGIPNKTNVK